MKGTAPFKKLLPFYLVLLAAMIFYAGPLHAATGEISGIASAGDLTVRAGGPLKLKPGDTVEISYMAGVMEMLIGTYRVKRVNEKNEADLRPVSVNMPPGKGMRVIINMVPAAGSLPVLK